MPNKIGMSALLMMVFALVPCLAGTPAWASADDRNYHGGYITPPSELTQDINPIKFIQPPQFLEGGNVLFGWKDKTDSDQNDFIVAMQRESQGPVTLVSTACVEISPVGDVGRLYLKIPRINGSCKVDLDRVGFYLNDETCSTEFRCAEKIERGVACRYSSPKEVDCHSDKATGPCIDFSDVKAKVNVICAQDNAACNECINWETGSPECTDYRTPLGVRIKMCVLENGETCPWKKCCKKKQLDDPDCQE